MTPLQRVIALGVALLLLAVVAGLVVRGRLKSCYAFGLYLGAVLAADGLIALRSQTFYRWDFWMLKETVHALLKFAVAVEIGHGTFRSFPGALATARRVYLLVIVLTGLAVLAVPAEQADYSVFTKAVLPRILNGTIWLFTAISGLILWYRLPVDPLHKAILIGFVPYLLVFTLTQNLLHALGWDVREYTNYAHTTAYLILLGYWNLVVWRDPAKARPSGPGAS